MKQHGADDNKDENQHNSHFRPSLGRPTVKPHSANIVFIIAQMENMAITTTWSTSGTSEVPFVRT
jgi:hypothetical protein